MKQPRFDGHSERNPSVPEREFQMMQEPRKTYSREFKIEAVRLAEQSGKPVIQLARELGLGKNQIYKWKQQLERHAQKAFPGKGRETRSLC